MTVFLKFYGKNAIIKFRYNHIPITRRQD